ncbi:cupin domain-containing protein [Actinomadura sp. HBU206391]|uniref:cupin domain-containing protein n=1 Tax=Actinomadura sp. HBU206391 TaxID=2731692 RepID=UPI003966BF99
MAADDHGAVHLHAGDEVLRVLSGELLVRIGDERRRCREGDIAIMPPNTWHGFRAVTDTVIEVIAEEHHVRDGKQYRPAQPGPR